MAGSLRRRSFWVLLALLAGIKIALLVILGPIHMPDSNGYQRFADLIVAGDGWFTTVDLAGPIRPLTAFRVAGYPLLLAAAKRIAPVHWDWIVVAIQMLLSLVATTFLFRLASRLCGSVALGLFAAAAYGLGLSLVMDQSIVTDSLNSSLLVIVAAHAGIGILERRTPHVLEMLGLGILVLLAFLLREAGSYLQFLYWPLILFWAAADGRSGGWLRPALLMLVFAAPMFVGVEAYEDMEPDALGRSLRDDGRAGDDVLSAVDAGAARYARPRRGSPARRHASDRTQFRGSGPQHLRGQRTSEPASRAGRARDGCVRIRELFRDLAQPSGRHGALCRLQPRQWTDLHCVHAARVGEPTAARRGARRDPVESDGVARSGAGRPTGQAVLRRGRGRLPRDFAARPARLRARSARRDGPGVERRRSADSRLGSRDGGHVALLDPLPRIPGHACRGLPRAAST